MSSTALYKHFIRTNTATEGLVGELLCGKPCSGSSKGLQTSDCKPWNRFVPLGSPGITLRSVATRHVNVRLGQVYVVLLQQKNENYSSKYSLVFKANVVYNFIRS